MKKGQMNFIYLAVGIVVATIALVLTQQLVTASVGNFTGISATVVNFIVPLMAVGLLVVVAYSAIGHQ
jgi:hypothetical protein